MSAPAPSARTTLVLSGGGAKAAAHLGAMRALAERGIEPSHYVATSMGSVVAVALAAGMAPAEIQGRMAALAKRGFRVRTLAAVAGLHLDGLLDPAPLRAALTALFPVRRFAELRVPVTITAVDLDSGATVVFGDGGEDVPLVEACMASTALPLFLPAVPLGGRRLADGGLRGVVPLAQALGRHPERVVAVHVGPKFDEPPAADDRSPPGVRAHNDATGILMAALTEAQLELWRATPGRPRLVWVAPRTDRNVTFRFDRLDEFAEAGYHAATLALGEP